MLYASGPLCATGVPQFANSVSSFFAEDPLEVVRSFLMSFTDQIMFLGWRRDNSGTWTMTRDTHIHKHVYAALLHVASCGFHLIDCVSMRLGTGKDTAPGLSEFHECLLCWWDPRYPQDVYTHE